MTDASVTVSEVSPLSGVDQSTPDRDLPEGAEGLKEAVEILADPDRIFSIRTWPEGGDWLHYYSAADNPNLVMFTRNEQNGASLLIWPVTRTVFLNSVSAPLMSSAAEPQDETSFDLTLAELLMLASLVDIHHEVQLQGFIDRRTAFDVLFTADDVQATYQKGLRTGDPRWMVSRLAQVVDGHLPDELDDVTDLLEQFCSRGFLTKDADGYLASPAGELVLRQLTEIDGLSSIVVRRRTNRRSLSDWEQHRAIYQSNRWQIWHYDVSESSQQILKTGLKVISRAALSSALDEVFKISPLSSTSDDEVVEETKCATCGARLQPAQKFCPQCGRANVALETKVERGEETQLKCTGCGGRLAPGQNFCPKCGTPANRAEAPTNCANCHKPIKPNARFCTGCGTEIRAN